MSARPSSAGDRARDRHAREHLLASMPGAEPPASDEGPARRGSADQGARGTHGADAPEGMDDFLRRLADEAHQRRP
jgi:hypothetical protein